MFEATMKYFTAPIPETPFTLALAIHWNPSTNMAFPIPEYRDIEKVDLNFRNGKVVFSNSPLYRPFIVNIQCSLDESFIYVHNLFFLHWLKASNLYIEIVNCSSEIRAKFLKIHLINLNYL